MPFLIGTDEAGYGPNLGPLVISASVWWLPDALAPEELYARLRRVICKAPAHGGPNERLAIADSKALYSPGQGLRNLERGVLAALGLLDLTPQDWLGAWQALHVGEHDGLSSLPWHANYDLRLPVAADPEDIARVLPKLRRGLAAAGVRFVALCSTAVFPEQFNHCTEKFGNKSTALSKITLALVARVLEHCAGERVTIICDKHGGRNFYQRLLQEQFPDPLVEVHGESRSESIYRWGPPHERIEVRFRAGGETFMPAALASMTSKYLRELAMRAFNDYWCGRIPDLAPTAGYPLDARRFRAAIRETQSTLGIADRILWRDR